MSTAPSLFDDQEPPTLTVDRETTAYVTTMELTLDEMEALARGEVADSLQAFAREWVIAVTGTPPETLAALHRLRQQGY